MKSLLKYASLLSFATVTMLLTGCGNPQPDFDIALENGRELAVESDSFNLTNQEAFELVAEGYFGLSIILDWVDAIVLAHIEIDNDELDAERQFMENFFDEDMLEEIIFSEGFDTLDDYFANIRLELLREQAILDAINITEEAIDEIYERYFTATDEDDEEIELDHSTEEVRELIYDVLRDEYLDDTAFAQEILATLRSEAGFTLHSTYFTTLYENILEFQMIEEIEVLTASDAGIVASIEGHYLSADAFFAAALSRFALIDHTPFSNYINLNLLAAVYDVDNSVIRGDVQEAKLNLLQLFYPQMEAQGLHTEQQIFDFFHLRHLQNLAFDEAFGEVSEDSLQELYNSHVENLTATFERDSTPERGARHILVRESDDMTEDEARELAEDIIAQLQAVSADEVEDLFMELAMEHGTDGTAERGGDLGVFGLGRMVSEFEEATFALEINTFTTEPVETQHGFHVIYLYYIEDLDLEEIEPLEIPTFEEMREDLVANELHRLRNDGRYISNMMFNVRAGQNMRFTNEQLQLRYEFLVERNRRMVED